MKTTFISSATLWNSPRSGLDKLQADLIKANKELSLGRSADVGLKLGYQTGQTISLRQDVLELDALIDSNANVKVRLDASTSALESIRETSETFRSSLISGPVADRNMAVIQGEAQANLDALLAGMNKESNGQYIFGGLSTQQKPMKDFATNAKAAIDSEFVAYFGWPQDDARTANITSSQMDAFLDGPFGDLFADPGWGTNWSNASSRNIQSSVSASDRIDTSVNANEQAFRNLAKSYVMMFGIGLSALNDDTRTHLVARTVTLISAASVGVSDLEAKIGTAKDTLLDANDRMDLQKTILNERLATYEGVDPAEAKVKVDQLSTQITVSYQLTAQLRQLSLINYI